jgi:hypothetical protein
MIYEMLTTEQRLQFERNKELDFSMAADRKTRFRVNVYTRRARWRPHSGRFPARFPPSANWACRARSPIWRWRARGWCW